MSTFSPYQWARACGLLCALIFIACMIYGYLFLSADPALGELHTTLLRSYSFGWSGGGMNVLTLILGTVVSAVYGFAAGGAFAYFLNLFRTAQV